ncbi:probable peptidoglycan muropeptide transporter SLC46 [Cherax quadricarinatus]|uniref:probable peptidoglycan muropeptide transporter SLC46 n=1 Tax=Cherax quadricarinatus TaxID=27406 RepID=UPI00387E4525
MEPEECDRLTSCCHEKTIRQNLIIVKEKIQEEESAGHNLKETSPWNPKNVTDLLRVATRRRSGRTRGHLILLLTLILGYLSSLPHNLYLWTRRVFTWDQNQYSLYSSLNLIFEQLGVLSTAAISRRLILHDCEIGAISALTLFMKNLTFGFLTTSSQWWVLYVFIAVPGSLPSVIVRCQISKLCDMEEVGRYFSLVAILEVLWPLIDAAIFTAVYMSTLYIYPSYEHLLGALFSVFVLAGFLFLRLSLASCQATALGVKDSLTVPDVKGSFTVPDVKDSFPEPHVEGSLTVPNVKGSLTVPTVKGPLTVPDVKGSLTVPHIKGSPTVIDVIQ